MAIWQGRQDVRLIESAWIPLSDGIRLAARIWLPEDAEHTPVPVILEYLPYRASDVTAAEDALRMPYLAAHGYAVARVDIRGTGNSDGRLADEYHPQEQEDALEVIAWLAAQPWCSGRVGMMGISWGGFNSLQVAARRPPALRAIITACSTDDRYDNDVHYLGGSPLACYMLPWATVMLAYGARPPDPAIVGSRWRDLWRERLEADPFLVDPWLAHQRRDDYWRQGSVCEDLSAIACPVFAVSGWADAYTDTILRLLEGLQVPRLGLIGPWGHQWPEQGVPGPAIGFLQESLRWWDHWLKDQDTGIMDEPMLRAWMPSTPEPPARGVDRGGRWVGEPSWPSPRVGVHPLPLADAGFDRPPVRGVVQHVSSQSVGLDAGAWCGYGNPADEPLDQRRDDGGSLTWTSEPLDEPIELLGQARAALTVAVDQPTAFLVARLCAVAPDGRSTLVTRGVLNLCHRRDHASPEPLTPGEWYRVKVPLKAIGCTIPAGHRLRLSLSTTYWPWLWPSAAPVRLALDTTAPNAVELPIRNPHDEPAVAPFGPAETSSPLAFEWLRRREPRMVAALDLADETSEIEFSHDFFGARRFADGLEYHDRHPVIYRLRGEDPLTAQVDCTRTIRIERGDWRTRIEVRTRMTADERHYHLTATLDAYEGDTHCFSHNHVLAIPRDHT